MIVVYELTQKDLHTSNVAENSGTNANCKLQESLSGLSTGEFRHFNGMNQGGESGWNCLLIFFENGGTKNGRRLKVAYRLALR